MTHPRAPAWRIRAAFGQGGARAMALLPVLVDDYGTGVYIGHWTGEWVWADEAVLTSGFYPGVSAAYVDRRGFEAARRSDYIAFAENERNCNTCRHLRRIPHGKDHAGWLHGICESKHPQFQQGHLDSYGLQRQWSVPQVLQDGSISFHPDDPMHMACYASRFAQEPRA